MKRKLLLFLSFLYTVTLSLAQTDSTSVGSDARQRDSTFYYRADLTVTNNGFAIIPAFALGAPAFYVDMRMGNKRLSFEPLFRFSLEGRPWSFVFIYRYKLIDQSRFRLTLGSHLPGLNFVKRPVAIDGIIEELSVARRFLALEVIPSYTITEHFSLGVYYLRGRGFQQHGPQNTNYLTFQTQFTNVPLGKKLYLNVTPQVFYLKVDQNDGVFFNATGSLGIKDFPLSISGLFNKVLAGNVEANAVDWNVGLVYTLDRKFSLK